MTPPGVGDQIPHLSFQDLEGATVSLDHWFGRPLILVFLRHPG